MDYRESTAFFNWESEWRYGDFMSGVRAIDTILDFSCINLNKSDILEMVLFIQYYNNSLNPFRITNPWRAIIDPHPVHIIDLKIGVHSFVIPGAD